MTSVLWHFISALAFISYVHRASGCARGERIGPSLVFLGHAHSRARACGLLDTQEYVGAFQSPLWTSIVQSSLLHFLASHLFFSNGISVLNSYDVKQLLLNVFDSALGIELSSPSKLWVSQNKDKPHEWGFSRKLPDRSNNDNWLRTLGSSKSILPSSVSTRVLFTATMVWGCLFSRLPWIWGEGNQNRAS